MTSVCTCLRALFGRGFLILIACVSALPLAGAEGDRRNYDIPAGAADNTIKVFSEQAGLEIFYASNVTRGVQTPAIRGEMTAREALDALLAGTGVTVVYDQQTGAISLRSAPVPNEAGTASASGRNDVRPSRAIEEGTGTIVGRVQNERIGAFLQGAEVTLLGTSFRTLTARDGSFVLSGVPEGSQELRVSYTGLEPFTAIVSVKSGVTDSQDVLLTSKTYTLEQFTVSAEREGNAAAITRQKNADNIVNVISTDAYGNVADGNIGTFMQKLPGVSAVYAEGDIIGVGLRGIPPNQSAITVDGALMTAAVAGSAATVQGDRAPPIDRLPAEFIKEIEVFKAPTPDRPVNGLGGSANLITKSAFDFNDRVVSYRTGLNHNLYRSGNPFRPTGAFTYMDTLGDARQAAISLSSSYTETVNARDRVQNQHVDADLKNTQARLLDDTYERVRWGYSAKAEFRLGEATQLGFDVLYSDYASDTSRYNVQANDTATRRVADYSVVSRAQIEAGAQPRTTSGLTASVAPGYTNTLTEMIHANWVNQSAIEIRRGSQYKLGGSVATELGEVAIRGQASYSPAEYDNNYLGFTSTLRGVGVAIDAKDTNRPVFTQTYGPSILGDTDFSRYTAQYFEQPDRTEEEIITVQLDAERPFATRLPLTVKAGAMWTEQHRMTSTWRPTWNFVGADKVQGMNVGTGTNDDNLAQFALPELGYGMFDGRYAQFQFLDFGKIRKAFATNPDWFAPVGTSVVNRAPSTEVTETVTAGYVMGRLEMGDLQLVGGVRTEYTDVSALGTLSDPLNLGQTTVRVERDYRKNFPSLHLRYNASANLLLRASYSTSMSRPSISQITPNTAVDHVGEAVTQGNPGLLPQYAENFDFSAEYYFEPAGVLSASAYQKDLSDYIFNQTSVIGAGSGNGFNGDFSGYDLVTSANGGDARLRGLEINYMQRLVFLPAPFDGLTVFANYTTLKSEGAFDNGVSELVNFIPRTYNAGLSYSWRRFQVRTSVNYQSEHLFSFNADPLQRQYRGEVRMVDLNLQYAFSSKFTVYADFTNIFNEWPSVYTAKDTRRMLFSEVFGSRVSIGISGRF